MTEIITPQPKKKWFPGLKSSEALIVGSAAGFALLNDILSLGVDDETLWQLGSVVSSYAVSRGIAKKGEPSKELFPGLRSSEALATIIAGGFAVVNDLAMIGIDENTIWQISTIISGYVLARGLAKKDQTSANGV